MLPMTLGWRLLFAVGLLIATQIAAPNELFAAGKCVFKPVPPVTLKNTGKCEFDLETLAFKGTPAEQARCLLNPVEPVGRLGPPLAELPAALARKVGTRTELPSREGVRKWLDARNPGEPLAESLEGAVSRARDNDPKARAATYFVIHDTSTPNYGGGQWPQSLDTDPKINNLERYRCANDIERAHVFINRTGAMMLAHDFDTPWRATKFEMATNFGGALKGLFLHVELIQPRRRDPKFGRGNDFQAPQPGFTPAQYDALALAYTVASVRAGAWLIPAFHAVLDEGIRNKHDDPQNFELGAFIAALERLLSEVNKR
jgi:hypothetical protein